MTQQQQDRERAIAAAIAIMADGGWWWDHEESAAETERQIAAMRYGTPAEQAAAMIDAALLLDEAEQPEIAALLRRTAGA